MGVLNPNRCIVNNSNKTSTSWKESGVGTDGSELRSISQTDIIEAWLNFKNNGKSLMKYNGSSDYLRDLQNVTTTNNIECLIFATKYGNNIYGRAEGVRVYDAKITENDNLVRNFIPCYCTINVIDANNEECEEGTIGLYDTVEGKFYTNQGTGTFEKGAEVN